MNRLFFHHGYGYTAKLEFANDTKFLNELVFCCRASQNNASVEGKS